MPRTLSLLLLALSACGPERELAPIAPCTTGDQRDYVALVQTASAADVLIVVDGTASTHTAADTLARALPTFLDALAAGDFDHDGRVEATPMQSIRVGVVTSDRGRGACGEAPSPRFVRVPGGDGDGIVRWSDEDAAPVLVETITTASRGACDATEPLAAAIDGAALFPTSEDGIELPQGVLIVLVLSDRDDASQRDVQRFASQLEALRPDPEMVVLALVAGVPTRLAGAAPSVVLADPSLDGIAASCTSMATRAEPPRQLLEAGAALATLGSSVVVASICADDDTDAFDAVGAAVARCVVGLGVCVLDTYPRALDGALPCDLEVVLPPIESDARYTHCADVGVPYERLSTEDEREVCGIEQLTPDRVVDSPDPGWFYDDGTLGEASQRPSDCQASITLRGAPLVVGSEIRMRCRARFDVVATLGASCDPATGATTSGAHCADTHAGVVALACDPIAAVCGVSCVTDADCDAAGRPSDVCDTRSALELLGPGRVPPGVAPDAPHGFCVSPTCG